MSGKRLAELHEQYENIKHSERSTYEKDKALAKLMTILETEFGVPALQNKAWESEHKAVIALYRIISESRSL
jgi:hypothetical protein